MHAASFIANCSSCGQANLVETHIEECACARCGLRLRAARQRHAVVRLALLAVAAAYAWAAWPVSGWLGLCLAAGWLLARGAGFLFPAWKDKPKAILRPAARLALQNLARASLWVGLGIALVGLAQIGLTVAGLASPDIVRDAELAISDLRAHVSTVLDFEVLLYVLGGLVAVTMLFPRSSLMSRVLWARSLLGRGYLVLLGLTSFTFFTAVDVQLQEERWQRKARWEARQQLEQADKLAREIAGVAWTESVIRDMSSADREATARFFRVSGGQTAGRVAEVARQLARSAPVVVASKEAARAGAILDERLERHVRAATRIAPDAPTLRQVEAAAVQVKAHNVRLEAVRTAAIEAAAEGIANALSASHQKPLVKQFVEELVGSLARGSLGRVVPPATSVEAAKAWVAGHFATSAAGEAGAAAKPRWSWDAKLFEPHVARVPHVLPIPGGRPFGGIHPPGGFSTPVRPPSSGGGGGFRFRR